MALLGGKKEARPPPVDRVRQLMAAGMSERDIVKALKGEGYSFGDVQKAMMEALKAGVGAPPVGAPPAMPPPVYAPPPEAYAPPPPEYAPPPPPQYALEYAPPPAYGPPPYPPAPGWPPAAPPGPPPEEQLAEAQAAAESAMEEVIEGMLEERMEKFTADIKGVKDEVLKISQLINQMRGKVEVRPAAELPREAVERLDDLEGRVGGLEKAFRQFLPSLTENIEQLSDMIHEMRGGKHTEPGKPGFAPQKPAPAAAERAQG